MKARAWKCRAVLALALALVPAATLAAGQAPLEEITVTARRISERLQELPVSATVVDGATLDDTAVTRWEDLPLPGIKVGPAGLTDVLSIRGMASGIDFGFEQSAPVFIDGVWFGSSRASRIGFLDTAQVEILKGPQPTWYGKNATAGAFGIITRKPRARREAWLEAFHEIEHEETALTGVLNLPLDEQLAVRMAGKWRRMDGFMTNSVDGKKSPDYRDHLGRASLRWTPSPGWTVDAKLEYSDNLTRGRETQYVRCTATALANRRLLNPEFENCEFDLTRAFRYDPAAYGVAMTLFKDPQRPGERIRNQVFSSRIATEGRLASGHVLQAIVAYYDHDFLAWVKQDHSWNQRLLAVFDDSNRLASQELRLASPEGSRSSWSLGAYHEDVARSNGPFTQVALPAASSQARTTNWHEDSSAWALFGELELRPADAVSVRAGGRYTRARRVIDADLSIYTLSPSGPGDDEYGYAVPDTLTLTRAVEVDRSRTDRRFTPAASLEWRAHPGGMYYLAWRRGFKAGGFSSFIGGPVEEHGFGPEDVQYWEGGAKWQSGDGRWRASTALFHTRYRDLQVAVLDEDGNSITRNAGRVVARGLDIEAARTFAHAWQVSASVHYLDSRYREFRNVACYATPRQTIEQGCVQVGGPPLAPEATICMGTGVVCAQDLSGFRTSFAPRWSGIASLRYQRTLPTGSFAEAPVLHASLDLRATESFYTTVNGAPGSRQGGYATLDARIAMQSGRWEVALLGRNLTNRLFSNWYEPLVSGGFNSGWFATTARPRQMGVQVRVGR